MKLGIFLAVITAAWVFDYFHQGVPSVQTETKSSSQEQRNQLFSCIYASQATFSLKTPIQKISFVKVFQEKFSRQEMENLNARSFYASKAEILQQPLSFLLTKQLISHRNYSLGNPDDLPHSV